MERSLPATTATPAPAPAARLPRPADPARAWRWLLGVFWAVALALGIGANWDRLWHATRPFDGFWSPPHLFTYAMTLLATLCVVRMALTPPLRRAFGPGFRAPAVPFVVPGSLALLAGGFAIVGLGGAVLDNLLHSRFGLDETTWSAPHAMIGWGLGTVALGFVACRLALRPARPPRTRTILLLGWLLLAFTLGPALGPFRGNTTPERVRVTASLPVLQAQPPAQHLFRIYLARNLTRTNPLFVPLAALWAGCGLAIVRGLDRRWWPLLAVVAPWSALTLIGGLGDARRVDRALGLALARDPANWAPPPILPAALALWATTRLGLAERLAWPAAGLLFGLLAAATFTAGPLALSAALVAAPALALGATLGGWVARALHEPTAGRVGTLLVAGVVVPMGTGVVDLWLRTTTP